MIVPAKVLDRLAAGLKRFQPVLASAKARDVNESDTSLIISDMLGEVFGYDKYSEVTRELCIRGTFCDLATRIDGKFQTIIEVKAARMPESQNVGFKAVGIQHAPHVVVDGVVHCGNIPNCIQTATPADLVPANEVHPHGPARSRDTVDQLTQFGLNVSGNAMVSMQEGVDTLWKDKQRFWAK